MACKYIYKGKTYKSKEEFVDEVIGSNLLASGKANYNQLSIEEEHEYDELKHKFNHPGDGNDGIWSNENEQRFNYLQSKLTENRSGVLKQNSFLQLLNSDNNWATFFIKSIIQDSAKKGYEKVLFPTGNTASKVEGHTTLEEFKKQKEDRLKALDSEDLTVEYNGAQDKGNRYEVHEQGKPIYYAATREEAQARLEEIQQQNIHERQVLKQELERVETEGFGALKPIFNFYENVVTNILNKTYGKENVKVITDEYGNTWNEVTITEKHKESIAFQKQKTETKPDITPEVANKLLQKFSERLGVSSEIITKEQAQELLKNTYGGYNGEAAFYYKGKVYLVEVSLDNLVHEFAHPLVDSLVANNFPLFEKIMEEVIAQNPDIYEEVEKLYPEDFENGNPNLKAYKEMAVRGITKLAKENIIPETGEVKPSALARLWNAIKDLIKRLLGVNRIYIEDLSPNTTLQELADMLSAFEGKIELGKIKPSDEVQPKKEGPKTVETSPFVKQKVFFERRVKRLENSLRGLDENSAKYKEIQKEIAAITTQFNPELEENPKYESIRILADHTLTRIEEFLSDITKSKDLKSEKAKDMLLYTAQALETFAKFRGTETKVAELYLKLFPIINEYSLIRINEFSTEKEPITQELVDGQTSDIGTRTRFTGALSDSSNYIVRTIGAIIKDGQNTASSKNKEAARQIEAEIKGLNEWAKKNGAKLETVYKWFVQETKGKYILAKEYHIDGTENEQWQKIQNTPELLKFYNFYQEQLEKAEKNLPFKVGKYFIAQTTDKSIKGILKRINPVKTRSTEDVYQEELFPDLVPLEYDNPMSSSTKNINLGDSLLSFVMAANTYGEMSEVLPEVRLLQEQLKFKIVSGELVERSFTKRANPSKAIPAKSSNIFNMVKDIVEMQVRGKIKKEQGQIIISDEFDENGIKVGEKYFDLVGLLDSMLHWNSLLRIGLSPITATANVLFGETSNIIEAIGGRYFGLRELHQASNIYKRDIALLAKPGDILEPKDKSVLRQIFDTINPLQELDDYALAENVLSVGKVLTTDQIEEFLYSPQKKGELFLQSRTMLAVMLKQGYLTREGKLTEKWNNIDEKGKRDLTNLIQRLNQQIHGRYSQREAAAAQQNILYRLVIQFRKWLPAAVEARVGSKQWDNRLQAEIEGRYITFFNKVLKNWKNPVKAFENMIMPLMAAERLLKEGKLSELEIYNLRKMMVEIIAFTAMVLLYMGLHGDDDEKDWRKNPYVKIGLTLLNRVSGDLAFFYSAEQITHLTKNAIPMSKLVGDLINLVKTLPAAMYLGDYKYKVGSRKGLNKFWNTAGNVTPGIKPVQDVIRLLNEYSLEELR